MIVLSNTNAQILTPGQTITFNTVVLHTGTGECHRPGTSSVKMKANGIYEVSFTGNIAASTATSVAQLSIAIGGEPLAETIIKSTSTAATQLQNVSSKTAIKNCCCDYDRVTVVNTGSTDVIVDANPSFYVKRVS